MPSRFVSGQENDLYLILATNTGGQTTAGQTTIKVGLPEAVTEQSAEIRYEFENVGECESEASAVTCTTTTAIKPGEQLSLEVVVDVSASASGMLDTSAAIVGGEAMQEASTTISTPVLTGSATAGIAPGSFFSTTSTSQAGAHPNAAAGFMLTTIRRTEPNGVELIEPAGSLKDIRVETPAGLIGSTRAAATCGLEQFRTGQCPVSSVVGVDTVTMNLAGGGFAPGATPILVGYTVPLYDLTPPKGVPAEFGFNILTVSVIMRASVRAGGDYGLTVSAGPTSQGAAVFGSETMFYGVPALHDEAGVTPRPFIYNPTTCAGTPTSSIATTFYQFPGVAPERETSVPASWRGCNLVSFEPKISTQPTGTQADSASGLSFDLHVPQNEEPEGLSSSAVEGATVTLPQGMTINPSAANGLGSCSEQQVGFQRLEVDGRAIFSPAEAECPAASKLGTVRIKTPLLEEELEGGVYEAAQGANPFGSLLGLYVVASDKHEDVRVKLAGRVSTNPVTGQVTASFDKTPELPFEDFHMDVFGGPRAALATGGCGTYRTTSAIEPYSGMGLVEPFDQFTISQGPGGASCVSLGSFDPGFSAGTSDPNAGGFTPLDMTLTRNDTEQNFSTVAMTMPKGLDGMISKVAECAEGEANAGTCPATSKIGHVTVEAGVGSEPVTLPQPGKREDAVYLTGPYNGAPFGLAIVVHPEAGPLNLAEGAGTSQEKPVVVRAKIEVDPHTAQVSVVSNPMPTILQGIPLDVRAIHVEIDRPEFMFDPTSCEPMAVNGSIGSAEGASASSSSRFQAANCAALTFKPAFTAETHASHSRKHGAFLHVHVGSSFGQANIGKVHVAIPNKLPARNDTLKLACTEEQFDKNPEGCPEGSIIGHAVAHTPVLPVPLEGTVMFVSHGSRGFPDVEMVLKGDGITEILEGRTFINKKGQTFSTFASVPDVPISSFDLYLPEGPHSALAGNGNLCVKPLYMPTTITGQNGAVRHQRTRIKVRGCKPEVRVLGHKAKGAHARLRVEIPSAGKLIVSGHGIGRVVERVSKAKVVTLAVALSRHYRNASARHKLKIRVKVSLTFRPAHGEALHADARLLMR